MLVDLVEIAPGCVRLPDLDQRRTDGSPRGVRHPAADIDAFSERLAVVLTREVVVELADRLMAVRRPGELRQRVREDHEWALWRPQLRRAVVGVKVRRLAGVLPVGDGL